ncbi:MAG: ATP-binding protein [Gammaproteobacteria bacterium]
MIEFLKETAERLINSVQTSTYRYLYAQFNLNNRLTGIIGPRGVGKTTLMLQYIKNNLYHTKNAFYFSADYIYFNTNSILDFVNQLFREEGIEIFFIDEIHKYKFGDWSQELKNIYDSFPSIKIIFSGSSSLDLVHGSYDLSRRAKMFYLEGMSLREYVNFKANLNIEPLSFQTLVEDYQSHNHTLANIPKMMGYFKEYLLRGYYPFLFEELDLLTYYEKISQIIEKTIFEDISQFYSLKTNYLFHLNKILNFLATIPPGQINIHNLAKNLNIDDKTTFNYLTMLNHTGLIRIIYPNADGNQALRKPEKIFLNNTTLLATINKFLDTSVDQGNLRELFFVQSLENVNVSIHYSKEGDYRVDKYIFEIGGKNKTNKQIKNSTHGFLIKDDILISTKNEIPLYFFGFLY